MKNVFISYSHQDEKYLDLLHKHLAQLKREQHISTWTDRDILAGGTLDHEIWKSFDDSEIFLALLSPDYIASNYCYDKEFQRALERKKDGSIIIIAIIVESCDWKSSPFGHFKILPKDAKPVANWDNENNAMVDVVQTIRTLLQQENNVSNNLEIDPVPAMSHNHHNDHDVDSTPEISEAKLIEISDFSIGFPLEKLENNIRRDNYISLLETEFSGGVQILFLEGDEDCGKTTLCGDFCRIMNGSAISVFFNPLNNINYESSFFYSNVVAQINYLLTKKYEDNFLVGVEKYREQIFQLMKFLRKNKNPFYFVVDGLEDKISEKSEFIKTVLDHLPIGTDYIKVILSGRRSDYEQLIPNLKRVQTKTVTIAGFNSSEIRSLLGVTVSDAEIRDIYNITKGFPGRLKTLKRILEQNDNNINKIFSSKTYDQWIEMDCQDINLTDPTTNSMLSILSLSNKLFSLKELAKITDQSSQQISDLLATLKVLEIGGGKIQFISNAYKKYFAKYLRVNKRKVEDLLIEFYASENDIIAKSELIKMYAERKQWQSILPLLDQEHLTDTLDITGSLAKVTEDLDFGILAAQETNEYGDLLRLSIQGSIVNELDNYLLWDSEIKGRIALKDFSGAIKIAESSILKVDRLRLLALIARKEKEIKKSVDEELINLISELYKTIDFSTIGEKIYDIVSDLIYALPNLAIEIIENASGDASEKNINDWVIAKLSFAAINSSKDESGDHDKKSQAIKNLNNPNTEKITRAINFLVGNYTAIKVLEEVKRLSDHGERLKLLRLWLKNNHSNHTDLDKVIARAIDELVLVSSEATLTLNVLKELSAQLAYIPVIETKQTLLARFKNLQGGLSELGLSKDKYVYELNIFHTEYTIFKEKSLGTLEKITASAHQLTDTLIKIEAYCEIYSKLQVIRSHYFKHIFNETKRQIELLANYIFGNTADHFMIAESFIKTLSKTDPNFALEIAVKINTVISRERIRLIILKSYLDNSIKRIDFQRLKLIEGSFERDYPKQLAVRYILERYSEAKSLPYNVVKDLFFITDKIPTIRTPSNRIYTYLLKYQIIAKNSTWLERLANNSRGQILSDWNNINSDWEKIDAGFRISSELSTVDFAFANKLFHDTEFLKKELWIDTLTIANTYLLSINLGVRALLNLFISNSQQAEDYPVLESLISRIPSEKEKLHIWAEFALLLYLANIDTQAKKIFNDHIIPLIDGLMAKSQETESIIDALVAVHVYNPELASEYIMRLSFDGREEACSKICRFYLSRRIPFEVYDGEVTKYECNYNDIFKAVKVFEMLSTDRLLYMQLVQCRKAILNNVNQISRPQITTISQKLNEIVNAKLPDSENIKHEGYKILSNFQIALINKQNVDWSSFASQAKSVTNISDNLFINSVLLEDLPFDKIANSSLRSTIIGLIYTNLDLLPSHLEFIDRVTEISSTMYNLDKSRWKGMINKAFTISTEVKEDGESYERQKNIVDSIYRLDPDFARELIQSVNNDSNRYKKRIKDFLETLEMSKKIKNGQTVGQRDKQNNDLIVDAIYRAQGALNANKISPKKLSDVSRYLYLGNKLPLQEVFPIYLYYLTNCSKINRAGTKDNNLNRLHRKNFEEIVKVTNLIEVISVKRKFAKSNTAKKFFIDSDFNLNQVIKPGSREEAINFIKNWLIDEMNEYLIIADPYFSKEDLEIIRLVKEINEDIEINIVGCDDGRKSGIEDAYQDHWKKITDEWPPFTNITFCWIPDDNNNLPIHDRWIITKNSGLRLGTSISSIGLKKESEISVMNPNEALQIQEGILKDYISRSKREHNKQRMAYKSFTL